MKKLFFRVALPCALSCLMLTAAAGQGEAQKSAATFHQDLAWSPDSKRIIFSENSGSG